MARRLSRHSKSSQGRRGCRSKFEFEQFADPAVEALDHAIGLWMTRRGQTMFDFCLAAGAIEHMATAGLFVLAGKPVGKLGAVVCEDLGDLDWAGFA